MKKTLFALALVACAATGTSTAVFADDVAAGGSPVCITFGSFCDAMQYDSKKKATWHNYDCGGSMGKQTTAKYKGAKASTTCDGASGCNPSAAYGWDSLDWTFNLGASTGTLTGVLAGQVIVLQQDLGVTITAGACTVSRTHGGISSLMR
jgi:hypothetical protein